MRAMVVCVALASLSLGGCVNHAFAPGPGMSAMDFEPDSARCRLFARGSQTGFEFGAYGSPKYVAAATGGAAVGYGVASAIERNQNYNDCMQARGWRITDRQQSSDAAMNGRLAAPVLGQASATDQPPVTTPTRAPLNVRGTVVTRDIAATVHLGQPRGILITSVGDNGAGRRAGLMAGDVILKFNNLPIDNESDMMQTLSTIAPNSTVEAVIWRNEIERPIKVQF